MSKVIHFEIPAEDPERAIKFYEDVFGWKIE
ncbi:MAG: VOC family protein, partial [Methanobacterium sp.]